MSVVDVYLGIFRAKPGVNIYTFELFPFLMILPFAHAYFSWKNSTKCHQTQWTSAAVWKCIIFRCMIQDFITIFASLVYLIIWKCQPATVVATYVEKFNKFHLTRFLSRIERSLNVATFLISVAKFSPWFTE